MRAIFVLFYVGLQLTFSLIVVIIHYLTYNFNKYNLLIFSSSLNN